GMQETECAIWYSSSLKVPPLQTESRNARTGLESQKWQSDYVVEQISWSCGWDNRCFDCQIAACQLLRSPIHDYAHVISTARTDWHHGLGRWLRIQSVACCAGA